MLASGREESLKSEWVKVEDNGILSMFSAQ